MLFSYKKSQKFKIQKHGLSKQSLIYLKARLMIFKVVKLSQVILEFQWTIIMARIVLELVAMLTYACGLLITPAKIPNFQYMVVYRSEILSCLWKIPAILNLSFRLSFEYCSFQVCRYFLQSFVSYTFSYLIVLYWLLIEILNLWLCQNSSFFSLGVSFLVPNNVKGNF